VETEIVRIAKVVEEHPTGKIDTLVHAININTLRASYNRQSCKKATGVDKITKEEYGEKLEENLGNLVERMKNQSYKPQPVRRTYIPKDGTNKLRPLGIPAFEDKIVQGVVSEILNEIYEPIFLNMSFGFRPRRSCHDALRELTRIIETKKVNFIVDVDIKGFFENLSHDWLMKFLEYRIGDPNLLKIIKRFLIAGVTEDGKWEESSSGAPQGGLISPILANVYLHYVLDLWFEKIVKKNCTGKAYIVRYADDFACCFQYRDDAEKFYAELIERLSKFGLEVAGEKSKILEFGRFAESNMLKRNQKPSTFDFLGFTHYCGKSKMGKFRVKRITSKKKMKSKAKNVKMWLETNITKPVIQLIKELNVKLLGHYNYYGITDNMRGIRKFEQIVRRALYKHLNRRRQRKVCNFLIFDKLLKKYPLTPARIRVSIYKPVS
jgi:group II intron reverse transcriptase/maturase